ncbi:MAG: hypothetical protein AMXMBFR13_02570 [Phycisphaerae bacterium]
MLVAQGGGGGLDGGNYMWIGLILMIVVFYAIIFSGSRKERKQRQDMLSAIKKNDRVMTIGGIIGTVISATQDEVVLKVDESANVKITVIRTAIQKVLTEDQKAGETK